MSFFPPPHQPEPHTHRNTAGVSAAAKNLNQRKLGCTRKLLQHHLQQHLAECNQPLVRKASETLAFLQRLYATTSKKKWTGTARQKKTRRWRETKACLCIDRMQRALAQISTSFNFKGLAHALAAATRAVRKHEECIVDAFELTKELLSSLAAQFNDHSYRATQAKARSRTVHAMRVAERKLESWKDSERER